MLIENFGFLEPPVNCFSGNCQIAMVVVSQARVGSWLGKENVRWNLGFYRTCVPGVEVDNAGVDPGAVCKTQVLH